MQAKILATAKKPNVRFASADLLESIQIQPILDGLQKVLQTIIDGQNRNSIIAKRTTIYIQLCS